MAYLETSKMNGSFLCGIKEQYTILGSDPMEAIQLYWVNMFLDYGQAIIGNDIIHYRTSKKRLLVWGRGTIKYMFTPEKQHGQLVHMTKLGIYDYLLRLPKPWFILSKGTL